MEGNQTEATPTAANSPRLLDLVRDAIRRKHYSIRTEQAYVHWIKRFIYFSGKRHPKDLGAAEVTAFLNHLLGERDVAAATQNRALSALLFMYKEALGLPLPWLERARRGESAGPDRTDAKRVWTRLSAHPIAFWFCVGYA